MPRQGFCLHYARAWWKGCGTRATAGGSRRPGGSKRPGRSRVTRRRTWSSSAAGYLGLWTAWQLKALEPGIDVAVLEAGLAGHGPSGRNGGFVSTLWDDLPILRDRVGDARALEVARASERGVHGIGEWCKNEDVDAWYRRRADDLRRDERGAARLVRRCGRSLCSARRPGGGASASAEEVRARCDAGFLGGAVLRTSATVHPARLSLGLRAPCLDVGVRLFERTAARRLTAEAVATTPAGSVRAGTAVLAVNGATAGFPASGSRMPSPRATWS